MPLAVVDLYGGLGNVLFQYAAALALQESGRFEVALSDRSGRALSSLRQFLEPRIRTASTSEEYRSGFAPAGAPDLNRAFARTSRAIPTIGKRVHRSVAHTTMRDIISEIGSKRVVRLVGYFQHPTWYEPVISSIFEDISSVHTEVGIRPQTLVVNLRRGDFICGPASLTFHFVQRALDRIKCRDINEVRIVSDDQFAADVLCAWIPPELFGPGVTKHPSSGPTGKKLTQDFIALASADHVVMSNSTFCWWAVRFGDWLASEKGLGAQRTVVYPQGWFGPVSDYDDSIHSFGWVPVQATYYPAI